MLATCPPSHQALVEELLTACSASIEELRMSAAELPKQQDQTQVQPSLQDLAASLQRERELQQVIMENTAAHLAYFDPDFTFLRVNEAYAQGSGYAREDLIGRNHFHLFPHPENQAIFERVRDTGEPVSFRAKPFTFPDQPERGITYWDWTLMPVNDAEGRVQGLVLSAIDVTDSVRTEEVLRAERDKAQTYLDIAGVILVVLSADQTVSLINRRGCEILGYEEEDIVGQNWFDTFIPEQEREKVRAAFDRLITGEEEFAETFENAVLTQSGEKRTIGWRNALLRDSMGNVTGTLSSGEDITERQWAEEQLRQQHQFLETILNSLPYPFYVINVEDYSVEMANRTAYAGRLKGDLTCFALSHGRGQPCSPADHPCPLQEILVTKEPTVVEHLHVDQDGHRQYVEVHGFPIPDSEGNVTQIAEYLVDITQRKQAEAAIQRTPVPDPVLSLSLLSELGLPEAKEREGRPWPKTWPGIPSDQQWFQRPNRQ